MQDIRGKRLLLLGSNVYKDIIKQIADAYGLVLIFAGLYPGELDEIADEVYRIDTTNSDVMLEFIKTHQIDGVYMGASELIISSACDYINQAGLPCICNSDQWNAIQNKKLFKQLCRRFDLPVTTEYDFQEEKILSYPVIVKPVDGCGSEGLFECLSFAEVQTAYIKARASSKSHEVIIEEKVKNDAIYAYYTFTDGKYSLDLTEDTYGINEQNCSFTKSIYLAPSRFDKEFIALFDSKIKSMLSSIGLHNGDLWFEVFHSNGKYFFNEAGFRPAGHKSMYPVEFFSGINQVASLIYYSLTGEGERLRFPKLLKKQSDGKNYCIYPIHGKQGNIKKVVINRELYLDPRVLLVSLQRHPGDNIENENNFQGIIGFVHFSYDDIAELESIITNIENAVNIFDSSGNSLKKTYSISLKNYNVYDEE